MLMFKEINGLIMRLKSLSHHLKICLCYPNNTQIWRHIISGQKNNIENLLMLLKEHFFRTESLMRKILQEALGLL